MLPPDCEIALAQLDAFRRGELPEHEMQSMQDHLEACRRCLSHKVHEEAFLARLAGAARNCCCPDQLRTTISQLLAKEARDH